MPSISQFPLKGVPGGFLAGALVNGAVSLVNGYQQRKSSEKIAGENAQLQRDLEADRQQFQLEQHERNVDLQRELAQRRHKDTLDEIHKNFENLLTSAEYQMLLREWPLVTPPFVLRQTQMIGDGTAGLRVIFCKCQNNAFNQFIYPFVEQGLQDFVDLYNNDLGIRNLIYYHNAFKASQQYGGAAALNIHAALKEVPTLIIDTNVLQDEVNVSFYLWGLGTIDAMHQTVFSVPFSLKMTAAGPDKAYLMETANRILAYLKFVAGYVYDSYALVEYKAAASLPHAMRLEEARVNVKGRLLGYAELINEIEAVYLALGSKALLPTHDAYYAAPEWYLDLAANTLGLCAHDFTQKLLSLALQTWLDQRGDADTVKRELMSEPGMAHKYIGEKDISFLQALSKAYKKACIKDTSCTVAQWLENAATMPKLDKPNRNNLKKMLLTNGENSSIYDAI